MSDTPIKDFINKFDGLLIFVIGISIIAALLFTFLKFLIYIDNNAKESDCTFIKEVIDSNATFIDGICIAKKDGKVYAYSKYGTEIKRKELIVE